MRVGYAWSALGRHTTTLQRRWSAEHPGSTLVFVQANTTTAGLVEGAADIAVTRRPVNDRRFEAPLIGVERRYAAVATDHPLARRRTVAMRNSPHSRRIQSVSSSCPANVWFAAP